MGSFFHKFKEYFSKAPTGILIVGMDGAGKTTILYQMKLGEVVPSVPTVGFNVETLKFKGLQMVTWDVGGGCKIYQLYHHYYDGKQGIIYVLDLTDQQRFNNAKQVLKSVANHPKNINKPILIFANKADMIKRQPSQIYEKIGLKETKWNYHIQPCCALNRQGLSQGFDWLKDQIEKARM